MNRRRFLAGMLATAVVAPLSDFEGVLETARPACMTLVDFAISLDFHIESQIVALLNEANDILDVLPWVDGDSRVVKVRVPEGFTVFGRAGV